MGHLAAGVRMLATLPHEVPAEHDPCADVYRHRQAQMHRAAAAGHLRLSRLLLRYLRLLLRYLQELEPRHLASEHLPRQESRAFETCGAEHYARRPASIFADQVFGSVDAGWESVGVSPAEAINPRWHQATDPGLKRRSVI